MNALQLDVEFLTLFLHTANQLLALDKDSDRKQNGPPQLQSAEEQQEEEKKEKSEPKVNIVVIGAGFSGLAAAQTIGRAGKQSKFKCTVIEARDRIGGRIWTPELNGTKVDLGASWIHGCGKGRFESDPQGKWKGQWNPLYQICLDNKIPTHRCWREEYVDINEIFLNSDGTDYQPPRFWKLHDKISDFVHSGKNFKQCPPTMSFDELVRTKFLPKNPSAEDLHYAKFIMNFLYALPNGADQDQLAAKYMNNYYKYKGDERFIVGGYSQITDVLAKGNFDIILKQEVQEIEYSGRDSLVKITTAEQKIYECEQLIVTLPLGVLKDNDVKFIPQLPKSKLQSIEKLGISKLEKLCMEFDEVFWDPKLDLINIIQDNWTLMVNEFKHYTGKPRLLLFNYGKQCDHFSTFSDEDLVKDAITTLKKIWPKCPDWPVAYARSNWCKDKYAKMCYAFNKVGSTLQDFDICAASVGHNRIHFAGEHTNSEFIGCTHNAYNSGVIAAERVIGQYIRNVTFVAFVITLLAALNINLNRCTK